MPELMVTEDRGFYCGGVHVALDLSLYLVEKFCGHELANDEAISNAQDWLHQNFHRPFPLEVPARRAGMSLRNFIHRFKKATGDSPLMYLQKLRIAAAKRLLEGDHRTIQEICAAVGYQDVAFFRALFQRHTGVSPTAYGERFGV